MIKVSRFSLFFKSFLLTGFLLHCESIYTEMQNIYLQEFHDSSLLTYLLLWLDFYNSNSLTDWLL